jgi:dATP pyrophosphohydrolase
MRAPFQVLIIPFRRTSAAGSEFAVLKRRDTEYWQFVAGGGEDAESPLQAARRETQEEIGVAADAPFLALDSMATVPKHHFAAAATWGSDRYVIPEYCFAVEVGACPLTLSAEHVDLQWVSYEEACTLLRWDSNRNALWELNERLKAPRGELPHPHR